MEFSVILAVKNEERLLPQVLPSIAALDPYELVVCFDRCTDQSVKIVREFCQKAKLPVLRLHSTCLHQWRNPKNAAYAWCVVNTSAPVILRTTADVLLDPRIKDHMARFKDGLRQKISFRVLTYPLTWRFAVKRLRIRYGPKRTLHDAVYAIGADYFREVLFTPADLSDSVVHERVLQTGGKVTFVPTYNCYLRPNAWDDTPMRLARLGQVRGQIGFPLWKSTVMSFLYLRPQVLREHLRTVILSKDAGGRL